MSGWVKIHRDIQFHWLWNKKPFSQGQAWIDILLTVNHESRKFPLGNEIIEVERGEWVTSEVKLMKRWGWSKSKVRAFLELLQNDSMIVKKTDRKKTTLKVLNYSVWQDSETTKEPQKDHEETTKRPQKDTNKNERKKECKKKDILFSSDMIPFQMASKLKAYILSNNSEAKVPDDIQKWAAVFEKMLRIDKRDPEMVYSVMEYCQKDSFWMANILSPTKLREKFDQLKLQCERKGLAGRNCKTDSIGMFQNIIKKQRGEVI